jgi:hypothetical protein
MPCPAGFLPGFLFGFSVREAFMEPPRHRGGSMNRLPNLID